MYTNTSASSTSRQDDSTHRIMAWLRTTPSDSSIDVNEYDRKREYTPTDAPDFDPDGSDTTQTVLNEPRAEKVSVLSESTNPTLEAEDEPKGILEDYQEKVGKSRLQNKSQDGASSMSEGSDSTYTDSSYPHGGCWPIFITAGLVGSTIASVAASTALSLTGADDYLSKYLPSCLQDRQVTSDCDFSPLSLAVIALGPAAYCSYSCVSDFIRSRSSTTLTKENLAKLESSGG
jgi:hypothetical protein